MADIANSSSCSCLPVPIHSLLQCFGFELNNPNSQESPITDAGIPPVNIKPNKSSSEEPSIRDKRTTDVFPPGNNEVSKYPISDESPIEDETIIHIFPPGNDNINPGSEDSSVLDETTIGVFPGGKDEMNPISEESSAGDETIIGVFPSGNDEAKNNPTSEYPSSDGWNRWIREGSRIDKENNPSFDESPSSTEQPPVAGGTFIVPDIIIPGEWGKADPRKKSVNTGASGKTH